MTQSPHGYLLASAGTGKTYRLTGHFLELLLRGVEPERILATTFTRAAAGEILDRVLERLTEAASDPKQLAGLNAQLAGDVQAEDCVRLLAKLTRGIDRFRIRTLDAFFVHVGKLFALDLGLPADWGILDEVEDVNVKGDAVARLLEGADPREWIELLRRMQKEDVSRSVNMALLRTVDGGRSAYLDSEKRAWEIVQAERGLDEEGLADVCHALEGLKLPVTAKGDPVKNWVNSRDKALRFIQQREWEELFGVGLAKKVLDREDKFSSKPIEEDVRELFEKLMHHAGCELVRELVISNEATYSVLDRFEKAYSSIQHERSGFRFEDLPLFLAPDRPGGKGPIELRELDLAYRLDARLDHILLDEFQDTSPVQWRILEPLANEILADGTAERSFFCVGDVKQSIYGWRDAEPRLLAGLGAKYPALEAESMVTSYRSCHVVLDTVNRVFGTLDKNAAFQGQSDAHVEAAEEWGSTFEDHEAAKELPGAVFLLEASPPPDKGDKRTPTLELAADRVAMILSEAPSASVGVLFRRRNDLARMIFLLRKRGIRASGEGGNPLTDSSAVLQAISLLHLADHPRDTAAAFHVACSPFGPALGLTPAGARDEAAEVSRELRRRLVTEGYGGVLSSLRRSVDEECVEWDRKRFSQLIDLAYTFDGSAGLRSDAFIDQIREVKVEEPSAAQVKVMTVHASKGLEFDAVVLPELDADPFPRQPEFLLDRPNPEGFVEVVSRKPKTRVMKLHPELGRLWDGTVHKAVIEFLCILYVAMTRAVHRLDMICEHQEDPSKFKLRYQDLLRSALADFSREEEPGVLWSHPGNASPWFEEPKEAASDAEAIQELAVQLAPSKGVRALPARSPSSEEGGRTHSAASLLQPRRAVRRGSLVHRWFEEVEWLETFKTSDRKLDQIGRAIERTDEVRSASLADFRAALECPNLKRVLSRTENETKGTKLEVWRERPFSIVLLEDGEETLWTGAFDRVVITRRKGVPEFAEIIDFKTDVVEGAKLKERIETYRPQVEGYRKVLAKMTGLLPLSIRCRLAFVFSDEVVEV